MRMPGILKLLLVLLQAATCLLVLQEARVWLSAMAGARPCHHYACMAGTVTCRDFLLKRPLFQPSSMRATAAETAASKILHGHAMALALDSQDLPWLPIAT